MNCKTTEETTLHNTNIHVIFILPDIVSVISIYTRTFFFIIYQEEIDLAAYHIFNKIKVC